MKVTFIGTGSGKTSLNRFHSSLLFSLKDYNLLIDSGDSISRALLSSDIEFDSINGIFFSHLHPDHFSGLASLIVQMKIIGRKFPLEIFAFVEFVPVIKDYLLSSLLIPERLGFEIQYKPFKDNTRFTAGNGLEILPRRNSHLDDISKYNNYTSVSSYSASFLLSDSMKKLIYTADVGSPDDLLLFKDFHADVLITEITHITLQELIDKLSRIFPLKIYLTHIPDESEKELDALLSTKSKILGPKIILASDGQSFEF